MGRFVNAVRAPKMSLTTPTRLAEGYALMRVGEWDRVFPIVKGPIFLDHPDQRLDQTPFLDITQAVERVAADLRHTVIYTHFGHDLNADHRIVSAATLTAFRPTPGQTVRRVYAFETLSSTE